MKILILTHEFPPFLGGLATTSYKLAKGLSEAGLNTTVLSPSYGVGDKNVDSSIDAQVYRIPALGSRWIKFVPFLSTLLGLFYLILTVQKEKPDVVLFITEEAEAVGGLMPWMPYKPVVRVAGSGITTVFHGSKPSKTLMRFPMKRLYRRAALVIAVSENTKDLLNGVGVSSEKIKVIYNGVEDKMLNEPVSDEKTARLRERLGVTGSDKVLATVARVLPRKGQDTVIKALPEIISEIPNVKYLVVGEGRYLEKFKQLSEELGVGEHVIFTGGVRHEDALDYYDISDIFIMPNRDWNNKIEGLPNAILEASARSKPVIGGNHGGSVEAVEDGVTGILVDPENVSDTARAALAILRDQELAQKMGTEGRRRIKRAHTEKSMIENYSEALKSAVGR